MTNRHTLALAALSLALVGGELGAACGCCAKKAADEISQGEVIGGIFRERKNEELYWEAILTASNGSRLSLDVLQPIKLLTSAHK